MALCAVVRATLPAELTADVPADDAAATAAGPATAVTACLSSLFGGGVPAWFSVEGITNGNMRLQMALLAFAFNAHPGLDAYVPPPPPSAASSGGASTASASTVKAGGPLPPASRAMAALAAELASKLASDASAAEGGSREASTVAQWINGLDIEGVYVRPESLAQDLRDGVALLQILDVTEPGLVQWNKVTMHPGSNRYKQVENCNYVVNLGRALDFHLVNVAGLDIVDGSKKMILAYLWQLMRHATLKQLSKVAFDGFAADENEVLRWANERAGEAAAAAGTDASAVRVASFADPELATGIYLLYLLAGVRASAVDWSLVADGDTPDQQLSNAKYVLSVARRLGVQTYCSAGDIVDVRPKAIMLFVASVMVTASREKAGLSQMEDDLLGGAAGRKPSGVEEELVGEEGVGEEDLLPEDDEEDDGLPDDDDDDAGAGEDA